MSVTMTRSDADHREIEEMAARIDARVAARVAAGEPEMDIPDEMIAKIAAILRPGLLAQRVRVGLRLAAMPELDDDGGLVDYGPLDWLERELETAVAAGDVQAVEDIGRDLADELSPV